MDVVVLGLMMRIDLRGGFDAIPRVGKLEGANVLDWADCSIKSVGSR